MTLRKVIVALSISVAWSAPVSRVSRFREIAPGVMMPTLNLGTCCGSDPTLGVPAWLRAGGVGIDTAFDYGDQPAIAKALATATAKRTDVFLTSKVPAGVGAFNDTLHGRPNVDCTLDPNRSLSLVKEDLRQLNVAYLDLVLLHGPCELQGKLAVVDPARANAAQWRGLEMALEQGLVRAIGVSNYNISHLEALIADPSTTVRPAVNQCQMSVNGPAMCFPNGACLHGPGHDDHTRAFCLDHNITYEAYDTMRGCPFDDDKVGAIAKRHGMSVAQVCTRWVLQHGAVVATGTGHNATKVDPNSRDTLGIFRNGFELSDVEVAYIDSIQPHVAPIPREFFA